MGKSRPVKTSCFIKFLEHKGCKRKSNSGGSHTSYKCPNCWRSIVIREADKEVPALHITTNSKTLNVTVEDILNWIEKNC